MIIIFSPHSDDAELGCGGAISKFSFSNNKCLNVIFSCYNGDRKAEAIKSAQYLNMEVCFGNFIDGEFDKEPFKNFVLFMDNIFKSYKVDSLFIPYPSFHQDHEIVYKAAIAALRPYSSNSSIKKILQYELPYTYWGPKIDGSSVYIPLSGEDVKNKLESIKCYSSQISIEKYHPRNLNVVKDWTKMRGMEISTEYAEKFYLVKEIWNW
jgi:LmbE family N-acetylglucosaminyl deacetylase